MRSIRPVLIVGAGDHTEMTALLRVHGFGAIVAADIRQALKLLRHFCVDATVCVELPAEAVRRLVRAKTRVIMLHHDALAAWDLGCAGCVTPSLALSALPHVLGRVVGGERGVRDQYGIFPDLDLA
jgi:hypothetical protein